MDLHFGRSSLHGIHGSCPHLDANSAYRLLAFCFLMGQIGMAGGNTIYYAFMPYLAEQSQMEKVSSWGLPTGLLVGL